MLASPSIAITSRQILQRNQFAEKAALDHASRPSKRRRSNSVLKMPWKRVRRQTFTSSYGRLPGVTKRCEVLANHSPSCSQT
jgi:hypothetical protein